MNRARQALESAVVAGFSALSRGLGPMGSRSLGRILGDGWYGIDVGHRRVARGNLELAFPEWTSRQFAAVSRAAFRHFAEVGLDLLRFPLYDAEACARRARVRGWEHLEEAHRRGRGVLVFSGHYGHWELVALNQGFRGRPMDMVTRPLDNPLLETRLARSRTASGNRVIHKRTAVKGILRALQAGRSVAIVIDQNFREPNRVFVDFFGKPAATTPTLGILAARTGAPVIPVFSWPEEGGRYCIEYHPEVPLESTGDRSEDALRLTQRCTGMIEEQIRRRPEFWLWMHKRWRTRPADELGSQPLQPQGAAAAGKAGG